MKSIIFNLAFFSVLIIGCTSQNRSEQPKPETPKALQENSSKDFSLLSKRSYGNEDLVESLYADLADTIAELKDIEKQIKFLNVAKVDSLKKYDKFNQNNISYYTSAEQHVTQIKDSVLRDKIMIAVKNSQAKYSLQTGKYNDLITTLNLKFATLNDLHSTLKVVTTLPIIEKYQLDVMPNTNSINYVLKKLDNAIKKADTLTNQ